MKKNILSENMARFGTKNLTESAKRRIEFENALNTIRQMGLQEAAIRRLITEQGQLSPKSLRRIPVTSSNYPKGRVYHVKHSGQDVPITVEASTQDNINYSITLRVDPQGKYQEQQGVVGPIFGVTIQKRDDGRYVYDSTFSKSGGPATGYQIVGEVGEGPVDRTLKTIQMDSYADHFVNGLKEAGVEIS